MNLQESTQGGLDAHLLAALSELMSKDRERLSGEPMRVVTLVDTADGFAFRDATQEDIEKGMFRIEIYDNPYSTGLGADINAAKAFLDMETQSRDKPPAAALPSDTTHGIGKSGAYAMLPAVLKTYGVDISNIHLTHIDNYVWDPAEFPDGPNENDFALQLQHQLIDHLVNEYDFPQSSFHAIEAACTPTEAEIIAEGLNQIWEDLDVGLVMLGLGDLPEVHFAYVTKEMELTDGFRVIPVSDSTIYTHKVERQEVISPYAITVGYRNVLNVPRKIFTAIGEKYAARVKELFSKRPSPDVVSSVFLEKMFRDGTVFCLDKEAARYILESMEGVHS